MMRPPTNQHQRQSSGSQKTMTFRKAMREQQPGVETPSGAGVVVILRRRFGSAQPCLRVLQFGKGERLEDGEDPVDLAGDGGAFFAMPVISQISVSSASGRIGGFLAK